MNAWVMRIRCSPSTGLTFGVYSDSSCTTLSTTIRIPTFGELYTDSSPSATSGRTFISGTSTGGCPNIGGNFVTIQTFTCTAPGGGGTGGGGNNPGGGGSGGGNAPPPSSSGGADLSIPAIVGIVVGALLLIFGGVGAFAYYRRVQSNKTHDPRLPVTTQRISDWGAATRTGGGGQAAPTSNPLSSPPVGSVVTLTGLVGTPELNGAQARVVGGVDTSTGRLSVALLNDPSRVISIKPSCVWDAGTAAPPYGMHAPLQRPPPPPPPPPAVVAPPPGLQVFTSPDGRQYMYNAATGETSWVNNSGSSGPSNSLPGTVV